MMATLFFTDRIIRLESSDDVRELTSDPEKFLRNAGALEGLKEYGGFDPGELAAMKHHDFRVGPLFCRHCESTQWITCGWSSVTSAEFARASN